MDNLFFFNLANRYRFEVPRFDSKLVSMFGLAVSRISSSGTRDHVGFTIAAQMMLLRQLVSIDSRPVQHLMAMRFGDHGVELGINEQLFSRISVFAQIEIIKLAVLRLLHGHIGARMRVAVQRFGQVIARAASTMVLSPYLNASRLAENDIIVLLPEHLGMKRGGGMLEYCASMAPTASLPAFLVVKNNPPSESCDLFIDAIDAASGVESETLDCQVHKAVAEISSIMEERGLSMKSQSFMSADLADLIEQIDRRPQIDWRYHRRRMHAKVCGNASRQSNRRISRRMPALVFKSGEIQKGYPGRISSSSPRIVMVIDTSGSMSDNDLSIVESEVIGAHNAGAEVWIMHCDSRVANQPVLFRPGMCLNEYHGRGGTDFRPAFQFLETGWFDPSSISYVVFLTDGYGTAPSSSSLNTLWVLTDSGMSVDEFRKSVCSWGEVVKFRET